MSKIYTKTGDKGYTTNLLNKKYSKSDIEMEVQGSIDEINAYIGLLRSKLQLNSSNYNENILARLDDTLKLIQYHLYLVGIEISTEYTKVHIEEKEIEFLEKEIDFMVDSTEPMKSFIYYFGSENSTTCHVIRTIVRRAERVFVRALKDTTYPKSYQYVNRLSDFFFAFSRYINYLDGQKDEPMILK
jgi:cob(I)alamin adenosyltransferase